MSYRDTLPFKAIGALTLSVELLFFKASWPRVPSILFELLRVLIIILLLFGMIIFLINGVGLGRFLPIRQRGFEALILIFYLLAPAVGPIFCFFRPTKRQFQNLKQELRLVCSHAERATRNSATWYASLFLLFMVYRAQHYGPQVALWHALIVLPFFLVVWFQANARRARITRAEALVSKLSPAVVNKFSVSSWSNIFVHSYIFDIMFFLAMISSLSLI